MKNDAVQVRANCSAKGCKWIILCSWCSGKKTYVMNHYVLEHSCLVGTSKNRRVIGSVIAIRFGDVISGIPFIRTRHLRAMIRRELGIFVTSKVFRHAKALVLKKLEKKFKEDIMVLHNYALELKEQNPGSNVKIVSENKDGNEFPIFQRMYICLSNIRDGFIAGCREIIGLDGCFLKGF